MFKPAPSGGSTPVRSPSTPQLPTTAARLLFAEADAASRSAIPHLHKVTPNSVSTDSPLADASKGTSPSSQGGSSACNSNGQTPKRVVRATGHSGDVPPLMVESFSILSTAAGGPTPLSQWSKKAKMHPERSSAQPQHTTRQLTTAAGSDGHLPQDATELMTLVPEHSQLGGSASSPTVCSSSAAGTPNSNDTRRPEHTSISTPVFGDVHSLRVSLNLHGDFIRAATALAASAVAAVTGEEGSELPSLSTPGNVPHTPEKVADRQDISPCTVSMTSIGGTITPTFQQGRGSVCLCDVSREGEEEDNGDESADTPSHKCAFGTDATVSNEDLEGSDVRSDGHIHSTLFTRDTEAYVSTTPSRAPFSRISGDAFSSPVHISQALPESDFAAQYPLFLPHLLSPPQGNSQVPAAQATPSHTDLQTHVFAESAARQTPPQSGGGEVRRAEEGDNGPVCTQKSPDLPSLQYRRHRNPNSPITVDAPIQFRHITTPSHSVHSHNHFSPFSAEADMGTQVFRSGIQIPSPFLQRYHLTPSSVIFVGEDRDSTPHTFTREHLCSPPRISTTPTRHPRETAPQTLVDNLFDNTFSSLHSQRDTVGHSGSRTLLNVSAVARRSDCSSGNDSMTSSPLLPSFDGGFCGGQLFSNGAAASPAGMAEIVPRADTPKSPHTPLDRRTPGPAGLYGSSYASLSEHSYGISQHHHHNRPLLSQPMTPQKSARRNYSLQTTPSQSFRSKVHSHSFESQQQQLPQQQAQFFNSYVNGLGATKSPANISAFSAVPGEATAVAERDYLAPSRNPFSLYRCFEVYTNPLLQRGHFLRDAEDQCMDDSMNSDATLRAHSTDHLLTEKQSRFAKELSTAVLRPDAAVVLYEQLIPAPVRAPGGHRPRPKISTSSQTTFDLLLHAPRPCHHVFASGSLSLSPNGRGVTYGQGWGSDSAAGAAIAAIDSKGVENSGAAKATTRSAVASPSRVRSVVSVADGVGRTIPHREACARSANANSPRPNVTLTNYPPRHVPVTAASSAADTPAGLRVCAPCHPPVSGSPDSTSVATSTAASSSRPCNRQDHDSLSSSAAASAAAASHLSNAVTSPNEKDANCFLAIAGGDSRTAESDVGADDEDPSPLPRQPAKKSDSVDSDQRSSCAVSPLHPERQLLFSTDDTNDDEAEAEPQGKAVYDSGDAAAVATNLPSPVMARSPLLGDEREVSAGTENSTSSPNFFGDTVAHPNPFLERPSGFLQQRPNPDDALHSPAKEKRGKEDRAHAATLLPSVHQTSQHLQQPHPPSRDTPELSLSAESTWARGRDREQPAPQTFCADLVCSSNEAASFLSPSAYPALGSVLDPLEAADASAEEIPGDRFQAHHEFQFLHYVEAALEVPDGVSCGTSETSTLTATANRGGGSGRPIPLCVEVNGVTWLATHRLNGLPYAVKEVPAVAFNMAELQCLTLSNSSQHGLQENKRLGEAQEITPQDLLEAEDYLARYYSVSTPPQDSSKPVVHLLQLEYFPRGSVHDLVHHSWSTNSNNTTPASLSHSTRSSAPVVLNCDFWVQVVQQGLRGLRVLHHARLVHGSPLPCCLFLAGHTSTQLHVKWSCFGSARVNADLYPTESLPSWISEAVLLLYKQYKGDGAVPADVMEVAVFCLGVLELLIEDANEQDAMRGLPTPPRDAAKDGLCHLEWVEEMLRRRHLGEKDAYTADEEQLEGFMQLLWNTVNSYRTADEVLAQMGVRIDPALHTVEQLYQYEIDRLSRQLQERKQQTKKRQQASSSSFSLQCHHERVTSVFSQASVELPPEPQPQREESKSGPSRTSSGTNLLLWSPNVAAGHALTHKMSSAPSLDVQQSFGGLRKSPRLFPRRTSAPCDPLPRAPFLDIGAERPLPSLSGPGSSHFFPHSTTNSKPAVSSVPTFFLKSGRPACEPSARRAAMPRGKSDVHPRVREAAQTMLMNALLPPQMSKDSLTPSSMWKVMSAPAVHSLRLRGWMLFYAGIPLPVTSAGEMEGCAEEETLQMLLTSLRPLTSFE